MTKRDVLHETDESAPGGSRGRTETATSPGLSVPLDELFAILSSRRRRYVLYALVALDEAVVTRSRLATDVFGAPIDEWTTTDTVERDLHHVQLPHIEAAGIIDYDRRQGTIRDDELPHVTEWIEHAYYKEHHG